MSRRRSSFFRFPLGVFALLATLSLGFVGCTFPLGPTSNNVAVQLHVAYSPSPALGSAAGQSSRLLLQNAISVGVDAVASSGEVAHDSAPLSGGSTTLVLRLMPKVSYHLEVRAYDSKASAVYAGSTDVVVNSDTGLDLYLIPVSSSGIWPTLQAAAPAIGSMTLGPQQGTSWLVDLGAFQTVKVPAFKGLGLAAYVQNLDGSLVTNPDGTAPSPIGSYYTIDRTMLQSSQFWLTLFNASANSVTPGGGDTCAFLMDAPVSIATQWVQSVHASSTNVWANAFTGVAPDGAGNFWAVGYVRNGNGNASNFVFGQGGTSSLTPTSWSPLATWWNGDSAIVVKYDSAGNATVANVVTNTTHSDNSVYYAAAYSPAAAALYAVGGINGSVNYTFPGLAGSLSGIFSAGPNLVIAKIRSDGSVAWAQTVMPSSYSNLYTGVAVDGAGNAYAGGRLARNGVSPFGFGNGITLNTGTAPFNAWVVVKYEPASGLAQWAKTTPSSLGTTEVYGMGSDPSGGILAVGDVAGMTTYDFGSGTGDAGAMNRTGSGNAVTNAAIARYLGTTGATTAAAVRDVGTMGASTFNAVCADATGIYAVGTVLGNSTFGFHPVSVTPANLSGSSSTDHNAVIVKFDTNLVAQWVRTVSISTPNPSNDSSFTSVTTDGNGRIFVGGHVFGNGTYRFGELNLQAGAAGVANAVVVVYNASGEVVEARSTDAGSGAESEWAALGWDRSAGRLVAAGRMNGTTSAAFDGQSVAGQDSQDGPGGMNYINVLLGVYR